MAAAAAFGSCRNEQKQGEMGTVMADGQVALTSDVAALWATIDTLRTEVRALRAAKRYQVEGVVVRAQRKPKKSTWSMIRGWFGG